MLLLPSLLFMPMALTEPTQPRMKIRTWEMKPVVDWIPESDDGDGFKLVHFSGKSAVCLDGTPGGFLWRKGTEPNSVVVHMEGGGWCYDEADCIARSKTDIGSSKGWAVGCHRWTAARTDVVRGSAQNPDFHNWTKFHLQYGDGASFAGSTLTVAGKSLLSRCHHAPRVYGCVVESRRFSPRGCPIVGGTSWVDWQHTCT